MTKIICPRCQLNELDAPGRNAISRYADVEICDTCGQDEALVDAGILPITRGVRERHQRMLDLAQAE